MRREEMRRNVKRNAAKREKEEEKKRRQRGKRASGNVERGETREFALLPSTLDTRFLQWRACVRIVARHSYMRVRRDDWSHRFPLSAQALQFASRILSLSRALSLFNHALSASFSLFYFSVFLICLPLFLSRFIRFFHPFSWCSLSRN